MLAWAGFRSAFVAGAPTSKLQSLSLDARDELAICGGCVQTVNGKTDRVIWLLGHLECEDE